MREDIEDYEVAIAFAQCGIRRESIRIIKKMRKNCKHWYTKMFGSCNIKTKTRR